MRRGMLLGVVAAAVVLTTAACTDASPTAIPPPVTTPPSGEGGQGEGGDQVTAILVQSINDAQYVLASDERIHVEYELLVVNVFSDPATLTAVTVLDPSGAELGTVEGDTLATAAQELFTKTPSPTVAPSAAVSVDMDLTLPYGATPPDRLSHRVEYTLPADSAGAVIVDELTVQGPEVMVDHGEATVIGPPIAGDAWMATSACCAPNVHRDLRLAIDGARIATAETFALDLARTEGGRLHEGDGAENEQFYGYGENLLAVADGTVVAVNDGIEDSTPFVATPPESKAGFGGNSVILEIGDGVYAAYSHLQNGSLEVAVGDTVRVGDVLGRLGNTGPSLGPHLHFAVLDRPDLFAGRSLPFVFDEFALVGMVDFDASTDDRLAVEPDARELREVYPLYGAIVDFPS